MALRTTLARLAQPLRAQSAAFSAIPPPRPKYTERQENLGRPWSPHVTTYAFPAVAISSITQRVTGVLLSVGVGGVGAAPRCVAEEQGVLDCYSSKNGAGVLECAAAVDAYAACARGVADDLARSLAAAKKDELL